MSAAESSLLVRACAGEREAFAALLRLHGPALRSVIQKRLPQRWQALLSADDVLQQTYVDALLAIGRFRPAGEQSFGAWLRKLAEHNLIEATRALEAKKRGGQMRRVRPGGKHDSAGSLFDFLTRAATTGTPSRHLARGDRDRLLDQALRSLPEHYQKVVRWYDLEDQPMRWIASELGRSIGAAHLLRVRALERLRVALHEHLTEFQSRP